MFNSDSFPIISEARNAQFTFVEELQLKIKSFKKLNNEYLIITRIGYALLSMEDHIKLSLYITRSFFNKNNIFLSNHPPPL